MSGTYTTRVALLRGADCVPSPWKNGGGVTREIAVSPGTGASLDAFVWRASVAQIEVAGPFSRFAGVDRSLVLLDGKGLILDETRIGAHGSRVTHSLTRTLDEAHFAGESAIDARLVDGPVRVFNVMVRRDAARGALEVWRGPGHSSRSARTMLLYGAQGSLDVRVNGDAFVALTVGDTLRVDAADPVAVESRGEGTLLAVMLDTTPARGDRIPQKGAQTRAVKTQ